MNNLQKLKKPPSWLWFATFLLSISGIFFFSIYSEYLFKYWIYLAAYNSIAIIIATFYIVQFIRNIRKQKNQKIVGAGFTLSLLKVVPILTIIPVITFYLFSFQTVQSNLTKAESSFNNFNINIVKEVNNIQQDMTLFKHQKYLDNTSNILKIIDKLLGDKNNLMQNLDAILTQLSINFKACNLILMQDEKILSASHNLNNCKTLANYKLTKKKYFILDKVDKNVILVELPLSSITKAKSNLSLLAYYRKNQQFSNVMARIGNFKHTITSAKILLNSSIIKRQFLIDFSTTILLTLLSMLLIVVNMVNKLIKPLNSLTFASQKIYKGKYGVLAVKTTKNSDINYLINQFNQMSTQIEASHSKLDSQNIYLQTIIKYSYGLIALDGNRNISLINTKVKEILNRNENLIGKPYAKCFSDNAETTKLLEEINQQFDLYKEWHLSKEITINNKLLLLDIRGAVLERNNKIIGFLIVIKDMSQLRKNQKLKAWNDIARRMAHEIKNPLNPIMLSAERLRNRFLDKFEGKDKQVIDKTTNTIINQVKSINTMVSALANYSEPVNTHHKVQNINDIINDTAWLYKNDIQIDLNLQKTDDFKLDKDGISRTLINLIKNSIESQKNNIKLCINITTEQVEDYIILIITDNGNGFNKDIVDKVFDPYITSKAKGGGLGMAIVEKIISQHNGTINIDKKYTDGARVIIKFKL